MIRWRANSLCCIVAVFTILESPLGCAFPAKEHLELRYVLCFENVPIFNLTEDINCGVPAFQSSFLFRPKPIVSWDNEFSVAAWRDDPLGSSNVIFRPHNIWRISFANTNNSYPLNDIVGGRLAEVLNFNSSPENAIAITRCPGTPDVQISAQLQLRSSFSSFDESASCPPEKERGEEQKAGEESNWVSYKLVYQALVWTGLVVICISVANWLHGIGYDAWHDGACGHGRNRILGIAWYVISIVAIGGRGGFLCTRWRIGLLW